MPRASVTVAVSLAVAGILWGCRDFHPGEVRTMDHTLLKADGKRAAGAPGDSGVPAKAINPELILRGDRAAPPSTLSFLADEADSLPLIASWAGLTVAEVTRMNEGFGRTPFGPGRSVTLALDPVAAARFNGLRDAHLDRWRHRKGDGQEPVDVIEHVMAKGETVADLLQRYPTTEDLLARENGDLALTARREGLKVRVPVLAKVAPPAPPPEALPAPKADKAAGAPRAPGRR